MIVFVKYNSKVVPSESTGGLSPLMSRPGGVRTRNPKKQGSKRSEDISSVLASEFYTCDMNGKKSNVTRDELYQNVWAEPMSKVGPQYGVSGSYLNRVCSELKVPTPAVGYQCSSYRCHPGTSPNPRRESPETSCEISRTTWATRGCEKNLREGEST
jgi:hypothetical protein